MASDMQFFLTSPFIIFPLWSSRRQPWKRNMGLALLGLLLFIFTAIPTALAIVNDFPFSPVLLNGANPDNAADYMMEFYVVPWCRQVIFLTFLLTLPPLPGSSRILWVLVWVTFCTRCGTSPSFP